MKCRVQLKICYHPAFTSGIPFCIKFRLIQNNICIKNINLLAFAILIMQVSFVTQLMREIRSKYADEVPLEVLEDYCRRYLHYYHQHVEPQPVRFYGAWGWSEARRREFRKAFDASRRQALK